MANLPTTQIPIPKTKENANLWQNRFLFPKTRVPLLFLLENLTSLLRSPPIQYSLGHFVKHLSFISEGTVTNPSTMSTTSNSHPEGIVTNPSTMSTTSNSHPEERCSLSQVGLEAILFDIDGTLCDSDPIHCFAFREMLQEIGFNGGVPITEEFFVENIAGRHNDDIARILFPDWDLEKGLKFMDDKEAMFRRLATEQLKPVSGLYKLIKWIEDRGLKRGAVTNAPRPNAELMISILGLSDFFQTVVVGSECDRAKPFPDPYLKGLQALNASSSHTIVFEDSPSGIKAGVEAGMPVVGITTRNPEHSLMEAGATLLIKAYDDPKLWIALEEIDKAAAEAKMNG